MSGIILTSSLESQAIPPNPTKPLHFQPVQEPIQPLHITNVPDIPSKSKQASEESSPTIKDSLRVLLTIVIADCSPLLRLTKRKVPGVCPAGGAWVEGGAMMINEKRIISHLPFLPPSKTVWAPTSHKLELGGGRPVVAWCIGRWISWKGGALEYYIMIMLISLTISNFLFWLMLINQDSSLVLFMMLSDNKVRPPLDPNRLFYSIQFVKILIKLLVGCLLRPKYFPSFLKCVNRCTVPVEIFFHHIQYHARIRSFFYQILSSCKARIKTTPCIVL